MRLLKTKKTDGSYTPTFNWLRSGCRYAAEAYNTGRVNDSQSDLTELRDVTCHMGSHSVTCHLTSATSERTPP